MTKLLWAMAMAVLSFTLSIPFVASDSATASTCAVADDGAVIVETCPGPDLGSRIEAAEAVSNPSGVIRVLAPATWTTPVTLYGRVLVFGAGTFTYSGTAEPAIELRNSTVRGATWGQTLVNSATVTGIVGAGGSQHAISIKDISIESTGTAGKPLMSLGRSYVGAVVANVQAKLSGQAVPALYVGGTNWGPVTVEDLWIRGSGVDNVLIESPTVWGGGGQAFLSRVTTEGWGDSYAGIHVKGVDGGGYITSVRDTHCEVGTPGNGDACIRTNVRVKVDSTVMFGSYPNPAVTCAVVNITAPPAWNATYSASVEMAYAHVGCATIRNDQTAAVVSGPVVRYEVP